jgi:hypothetical protein
MHCPYNIKVVVILVIVLMVVSVVLVDCSGRTGIINSLKLL